MHTKHRPVGLPDSAGPVSIPRESRKQGLELLRAAKTANL